MIRRIRYYDEDWTSLSTREMANMPLAQHTGLVAGDDPVLNNDFLHPSNFYTSAGETERIIGPHG